MQMSTRDLHQRNPGQSHQKIRHIGNKSKLQTLVKLLYESICSCRCAKVMSVWTVKDLMYRCITARCRKVRKSRSWCSGHRPSRNGGRYWCEWGRIAKCNTKELTRNIWPCSVPVMYLSPVTPFLKWWARGNRGHCLKLVYNGSNSNVHGNTAEHTKNQFPKEMILAMPHKAMATDVYHARPAQLHGVGLEWRLRR